MRDAEYYKGRLLTAAKAGPVWTQAPELTPEEMGRMRGLFEVRLGWYKCTWYFSC